MAAYAGMLLNAAVTSMAGAIYLVGATLALRRGKDERWRGATVAVLALVSAHLLIAGARQLVGYLSTRDASLTAVDGALFLVVNYVGALSVIPLAYLVLLRLGANRVGARGIAAGYLLVTGVGLAAFTVGGIDGPVVSEWGTDWSMRSGQARVMLAFLFAIPAFGASAWLLASGAAQRGADGQPSLLLGAALLVYYGAMVPDAFGLDGVLLLSARVAAGVSALLACVACFQMRATRGAVTG